MFSTLVIFLVPVETDHQILTLPGENVPDQGGGQVWRVRVVTKQNSSVPALVLKLRGKMTGSRILQDHVSCFHIRLISEPFNGG